LKGTNMKKSDITIGGQYKAKVSDKVVTVENR
jgi:hypothetical protein